ncbi:alpha/beta hydrolase [Micromonospora cathayae]|uniref:Alpha/beta fold hydrolase n=1 Tax=Micromonospora cathayae TaxID=3028804 RepID=A0ABY7ZQ65_9ACTN|nr:alpha/beta fold hydrolase [Micromonospora sp. HUAS 3]WDZ84648.1 alpha/beta fold hydrolase [Micromonospora sp. HUAS 3]
MDTGSGKGQVDTVVLIHGLWLTPRSFQPWVDRYVRQGFRVLAPAWPGLEGEVEQLRTDPTPIARLTMSRIVAHYERIVRDLARPPIIMGHGHGGTVTQILLDHGYGAAGVGIGSAPVKGLIRMPWSMLRATGPVLRNPANRHRAVPIDPDRFHRLLANTTDRATSERLRRQYAVPAAGHVVFETALAGYQPRSVVRVDNGRSDRAPLLLLAGGADRVVPPVVVKANAGLYQRSRAVTAYHGFPDRPYLMIGAPGWEEVADHALRWAVEKATTVSPAVVGDAPRW